MFGKYKPLWGKPSKLNSAYDAVIIGGGLHGLAAAYFLARDHGLTNVAVIEKHFIGFGGSEHRHCARQPADPGKFAALPGGA